MILLILFSPVSAQATEDFDPISVPTSAIDRVPVGSTYTVKWDFAKKYDGTVTLNLLEGSDEGSQHRATPAIASKFSL